MFDTLTYPIPISAGSLSALAALASVARWLAEVIAVYLPQRMNHEWSADVADFRGESFEQKPPRLRDVMQTTGWLPQAIRSHLGGSSRSADTKMPVGPAETLRRPVSGSKVDLGQLAADAIALFGPFAAVFAHNSIDLSSLLVAVLCWVTAAVIIIDREHFLIPDAITQPMLWLGLLANTIGTYQDCRSAIASAALAYLALWTVGKVFHLMRGEDGIGMGDAKWLAVAGAWFGATTAFGVLIVACVAGATYAALTQQRRIAFGPMLSVATVCAGVWTLI